MGSLHTSAYGGQACRDSLVALRIFVAVTSSVQTLSVTECGATDTDYGTKYNSFWLPQMPLSWRWSNSMVVLLSEAIENNHVGSFNGRTGMTKA